MDKEIEFIRAFKSYKIYLNRKIVCDSSMADQKRIIQRKYLYIDVECVFK